ncbi:MAG: sensor histidine kinase [Eubacteriales bacterium]|nr:sensor histidine kinase [Eubacteriales bacterium]
MNLRKRLVNFYRSSSLVRKIQLSYSLVIIPILLLLVICIYSMNAERNHYDTLVDAVATASDFSLEFKKDYDYQTYLVIVGNKTPEESDLDQILADARSVVNDLTVRTDSPSNLDRLKSAGKYLENLQTYKERIEENLLAGNQYEANMEIWENDVQVVTGLIHETLMEYIYYEIRDIQQDRAAYKHINALIINTLIIAALLATLLAVLLSHFVPLSITRPLKELCIVTDQVAKGDLTVRNTVSGGVEVNSLSESLNTMIDKINELLQQVTTEQIRLRKAELDLLQSQINPHFLYNTLDTITWLAESGEKETVVAMVDSLSRFFRTSLNQGKDIVSLREEISHIRSYLEIQQVRYQDILEYSIDIPAELMEYRIPKITLQPLVENALYHGIKNKRGLGHITVTGESHSDSIYIYIRDDGIGMDPETLEKIRKQILRKPETDEESFGLYNVNERIRLKFGEEYGLELTSTRGEGTVAAIRLPKSFEG